MNRLFQSVSRGVMAASLAMGLSVAASAEAGVILVDNFSSINTDYSNLFDNTADGNAVVLTDTNVLATDTIKARREVSLSATALPTPVGLHRVLAFVDDAAGEFVYSSTTRASGDTVLTYGSNLAVHALNLNLTGHAAFEIDVTYFDFANDLNLPIQITLRDGNGLLRSATQTLTSDIDTLTTLNFSLASFTGAETFNWADVDRIQVALNAGRAADYALSEIRIVEGINNEIPEPATLGVMLLGGAALLRRRRA